jgi:phospholipase/lecithinase/hemolysin
MPSSPVFSRWLSFVLRSVRLARAGAALLTLAACGESSTEPSAPALFSSFVVFGASLDDTGNACNVAPTSCPPFPYANARFSNGPLYVEVLADSLGARVVPARAGGGNFAFGGARTGPIAGTTQAIPNMLQQVDLYLENGATANRDIALYVVNAATVGNDITDALTLGATNPQAPAAILSGAVSNITGIIGKLYQGGARHVLLLNSTDIGRTPQVVARGPLAASTATFLSTEFNRTLADALPALRSASPGLTIYVVDLGAFTAEVVANPSSFGLTNITAPCVVLAPPSLCSTPDSYLYWDAFHPTAAAGRLIARRALRALGR